MANENEVRKATETARAWKPLKKDERAALLAVGKTLAETRGLYYGPVTG
jgi:hypothetical protein